MRFAALIIVGPKLALEVMANDEKCALLSMRPSDEVCISFWNDAVFGEIELIEEAASLGRVVFYGLVPLLLCAEDLEIVFAPILMLGCSCQLNGIGGAAAAVGFWSCCKREESLLVGESTKELVAHLPLPAHVVASGDA